MDQSSIGVSFRWLGFFILGDGSLWEFLIFNLSWLIGEVFELRWNFRSVWLYPLGLSFEFFNTDLERDHLFMLAMLPASCYHTESAYCLGLSGELRVVRGKTEK